MRQSHAISIQRHASAGHTTDPAPGRRVPTSRHVAQVAAAGVDGAGEALPHAAQVQAAFGSFDLSDVRVATGAPARDAAREIGAAAYTTGDRIAFGAEPTLHLVAHEAAHVVQQRAGVSLDGGVGASGDAYERHADQVADAVVRGESAEPLLAASPGAGGGGGVQRFDSPSHVAIGDSVEGEHVEINGVDFSPGELSALADYVGDVTVLRRFDEAALTEMKALLAAGNEECEEWDRVTGGLYSEEAQNNEKHFAPGGDGRDFRTTFIEYAGLAFERAGFADPADQEAVEDARLSLYTAEHYLQDAFSAGHHVAAIDVEQAVDAVMSYDEFLALLPDVAGAVYDRVGAQIRHYGLPVVRTPITRGEFQGLAAVGGVLVTGPGGFDDALRRYVHEGLDKVGVEVASLAHPEPWVLRGDHTAEPTSVAAVQVALSELRTRFEQMIGNPVDDPQAAAELIFMQHAPTPTATGAQAIADTLADATRDEAAIRGGVIQATCETIEEAMDVMVGKGVVVELSEVPNDVHDKPIIAPYDPDAPPTAPGGDWQIPDLEQGGDYLESGEVDADV